MSETSEERWWDHQAEFDELELGERASDFLYLEDDGVFDYENDR